MPMDIPMWGYVDTPPEKKHDMTDDARILKLLIIED